MHQHPRPAPRSASSASTPQTNPQRTNNQRDDSTQRASSRQSLSSESGSGRSQESETGRTEDTTTAPNPDRQRLNLIVQHFFSKAALIVLNSRVNLPPAQTREGEIRLDKWFNTWIRDTNVLSQDLNEWKNMDAGQRMPSSLTVDFYIDLNQHPQNQALVAIDDDHKRWDVAKSLDNYAQKQNLASTPKTIVYERWTISLEDPSVSPTSQIKDAAPNIYKKGVVLLRSLYTYARLLPAWKFARRISKQAGNGVLPKPKFRLSKGSVHSGSDTLAWPLTNDVGAVTEDYHFSRLPCAFGSLRVSVKYRTNCNFELDAAERLLSAQIATGSGSAESASRTGSTSDELASDSRYKPWIRMPSAEGREELPVRGGSDARAGSGSKSSLRSEIISSSMPRRTSVSFQPFKAGSLSSSPAGGVPLSASPNNPLGRPVGTAPSSHSRSRSSLNTLPQQALRNPGIANETAIASSASSSPKPAPIQRYSSSFQNRRARFPSSQGTTKTEEDGSSSRGSVSSAQRASFALPENESSYQDDSESIGDFLKMLDKSSKQLPSFSRTDPASLAANSQRTVAQYSKFAKMRDSTAQLSDSMSSSLMLQRSSSSSSRQLSNVPGLVGGTAASISTSSSPSGKPISPHTPHMPAVPSRLSNNSIASYSRPATTEDSNRTIRADSSHTTPNRPQTTTPTARAIDIPNSPSPRTFPVERRSSSVHNNARPAPRLIATGAVDDDMMPFGLRSASLPSEERNFAGRLQGSGAGGSGIRGEGSGDMEQQEEEEEEPLLFDLGELGRESLRRTE
ncbi:Autophagy-related protein 13 [Elsinoe australis]|uniref:Autophagy-related protein 13 n=1 Tax=Elsinoe australis TaxID=40998 RepID=A0A2P7Z0W4_9PEZI|nr:Autophagy-related protein 13 [Elsinoe australis]